MTDQDHNTHGTEEGETKTFTAVGDAADETKAFSLQGGTGGGPIEKGEERGAMRDFTPASLLWRILRPLLILAVSAGLVIWIGVTGYHYVEDNYFLPVDAEATEMESVTIKPGSSLSTIASLLFDMGIVRNKLVFQMYVDLNDMGSGLVAGTYELSPSMTMEQIMGVLAEGDGGRETLMITLTEGMTAVDMADSLYKNEVFNEDERDTFLTLCNDAEAYEEYGFIAELTGTDRVDERNYLLEGYLFPDTYEIYADATPDDIIRKLLDRFDVIMTLEYEDRAETLGMTIDEVVTLASIIEWEALPKDYSKVSAVFFNRLSDDTPLGSCATMRYVTGEKKFVYTAEELEIDSPFNTYKYAGLPIGPVSNPGKKAIESALFPDEEYMEQGFEYFCTADPETGDLAFAKTLDEHNDNVAMYEDLW